jgi:hypothetical protein
LPAIELVAPLNLDSLKSKSNFVFWSWLSSFACLFKTVT